MRVLRDRPPPNAVGGSGGLAPLTGRFDALVQLISFQAAGAAMQRSLVTLVHLPGTISNLLGKPV